MGKRTLACLGLAWALLATPAFAEPDFAAAFKRLDRNSDGLISLDEIRLEGVDVGKYLEPVGVYKTDDGFGVELWLTPFGVLVASTEAAGIEVRAAKRARTLPRDREPNVRSHLMLAANPELRTMTPERFEAELRRSLEGRMGLDLNGDGGISTDEIRSNIATSESAERSLRFQSGPGGDAMRAKKLELNLEVYAGFDLDADGRATRDEILECWLANLVGAFALP